jgi:broad specificity phosphatase PhoE
VTHGGPIRTAAAFALGVPLHEVRDRLGSVGNAAVVRIDVRDGILEALGLPG